MKLVIKCKRDAILKNTLEILDRQLQKRGCRKLEPIEDDQGLVDEDCLVLDIDESYPAECYGIEDLRPGVLQIKGGSSQALLYGIGKMLRTGNFEGGDFEFGSWRGLTSPQKPERIVFFASHFHNYYHIAPIAEVREYVEELALWGYNRIIMWVDKHHYTGKDDPALIQFVDRVKSIYQCGISVGMKPILCGLTNEGYSTTPKHLRATETGRCIYGCEICPSTPEGMELILKNHADTLEWFEDMDVSALTLGSYDTGGCGCEKCFPWGAKAMFDTGEKIAALFRKSYPQGKIIYVTWLFDFDPSKGEKEWEGLDKRLSNGEGQWLDMIMADSHEDFPRYPLENGVPGNRPMLNFPEISMWGMHPWGGIGGNPLPKRLQRLWGQVANHCAGGLPYSEGNYEDFNKALYAGFYWNGNNEISQTVAEYFNFEFGCRETDRLLKAFEILEQNHCTDFNFASTVNAYPEYVAMGLKPMATREGGLMVKKVYHADPAEAYRTFDELDKQLPNWGKRSWRWRIHFLRALIDCRLKENGLEFDEQSDAALEELAAIFHSAGMTEYKVSPVTRESVNARRSSATVL